ncbi:MAG: hypothetical protein C0523_07240 [Cytophaga sp.]|nr:hypothetical protein [Cytophaga sp.]
MLLNDFFHILHCKNEQQTITATLQINKQHAVFNGHFPGQPVVPGVCMMQMVKEVLERETQQKYLIREADHLKFLTLLDPTVHPEIEAEIKSESTTDGLKVVATLFTGDVIFFKIKSTFHTAS